MKANVAVLRHFAIAAICIGTCAFLISAPAPKFTQNDKAYYADPNLVNFVRPGLVLKITSAEIAADGTIKARFKLTDPAGAPLEREGITTPGPVSVSVIAAFIPKGKTQYWAYTTRVQTSPINNVSATQAGTDSGGVFEKIADGEYFYTFRTKAPAGFDKTATHTIGAYATRNLAEFDMGSYYDDDAYNFVPDGSKVTVVRDVIRTASCNKCHDQMAFHGGPRRTMEVCVLCHTPQTFDPDTGNTVDMPVMIHKIHMGSSLPSVQAGKPYQIIGNRQSVNDYSEVVFPADARNCFVCHEKGVATQADNVYKANQAACGACHDLVNFKTGEGHADLPQVSDNQCSNCHFPKGETEFDTSIVGAHVIPRLSPSLPGVVFELLAVKDGVAGKSPTVTFSLKDKSGKPILPSAMDRLSLILAGPTSDYATYVSEDARKATGIPDGTYFWTFTASIPANAKGSYSVTIEGRKSVTLMPGTKKEVTVRDAGANKAIYSPVDGSKVEPRRTVVALANCNACHFSLSFHGDNRNAIEACVVCHNPTRSGGPAPGLPIDFSVMIHRIHTGKELTIPYSFSASANFNEVGYPGDRRNCSFCHVNGSEQLPLSAKLLPVTDPSGPLNPMGATTAACTGCHTQLATFSHALANTTTLGESCAACHGPNAEFSVTRVHAR